KWASPGNGEIAMAIPLAMGWDRLACLFQAPFALLGAWAVARLARLAGASAGGAAGGAPAVLSAPPVANQAAVARRDPAAGSLSLAALALLLSAEALEHSSSLVAVAGLAFGLALGTKHTAMAHFALLVVAVVAATPRDRWRRLARPALLFAAVAALPAAF